MASGSLIFYTTGGIFLALGFAAHVVHAVLLADGRRAFPGPYEAVLSPARYYAYLQAVDDNGYPAARHSVTCSPPSTAARSSARRTQSSRRGDDFYHRGRRPGHRLSPARSRRRASVLRGDRGAADGHTRGGLPTRRLIPYSGPMGAHGLPAVVALMCREVSVVRRSSAARRGARVESDRDTRRAGRDRHRPRFRPAPFRARLS